MCVCVLRIIAVLTPNYLDKPECLEQFNLALCCNRLTKAEVLAPFYMQTVDVFPSYMTLIQYTECRCVFVFLCTCLSLVMFEVPVEHY